MILEVVVDLSFFVEDSLVDDAVIDGIVKVALLDGA